jgi:hypothetical protein
VVFLNSAPPGVTGKVLNQQLREQFEGLLSDGVIHDARIPPVSFHQRRIAPDRPGNPVPAGDVSEDE